MADTPIDERKFTEHEVREILKNAVSSAPSRELMKGEGMSLAELKVIGAEVGIDSARLEDAARAVTRHVGNRPNRILGAPTLLNFERRVDRDFDPKDTPKILSLIRRTVGHQGEAGEIHGSLEWSAKTDVGERHVSLSSTDGITTVRTSANLSSAAILTYLPAGVAGTFASLLGVAQFGMDGNFIGVTASLAVLPALYMLLRRVLGRVSAREAARLERLVEDLARQVAKPED